MFHIVVHCKPKRENEEFFGKVIGAYASILIDYKDYEGVMALSKYYVEENGWEIMEVDEKYFTFETQEELPEDYHQYFNEIVEYGYSLVFNMYDNEEGDEEE